MLVRAGNALPDRTIELLTKHKLGLFAHHVEAKQAAKPTQAELQGRHVYYSPIVTMRQKFNLDICCSLRRIHRQSAELHPQNTGRFDEPKITPPFPPGTEGMYAGVEWTNLRDRPRRVEQHLASRLLPTCPTRDRRQCRISLASGSAHRQGSLEYAKKRGFKA